ncbi:AAA family ATPase [Cystobacter fuscus]|uniref:AAA family ATPase n=1 Tax=Cystobacter fuscus TaxID=43 RepID=UPI0012FDCD76|nr:ATP-binding protein [Cystobacter fuscus]
MPLPFEHLSITAFRGLRELTLEKLGRVNLLVGLNDSGKTSVLEAVSLMARPLDQLGWVRLARQREPSPVPLRYLSSTERIRWLFPPSGRPEGDPAELVIKAGGRLPITDLTARFKRVVAMRPERGVRRDTGALEKETTGAELHIEFASAGQSHTRSFTLWPNEPTRRPDKESRGPPCEVVLAYHHWMPTLPLRGYSQARLQGTSEVLARLLSLIDPEIRGLEILQPEEEPVLYVTHAIHGPVPLSVYGDGIRRTLLLAESVVNAKGGLLLVDEIETGIHVSALSGVYSWLVRSCREFDVQLFVTTHSLEAIDALLAADTTPEEDVVAFKLGRHDGRSVAKRYGEGQLKWMRFERGLEVR